MAPGWCGWTLRWSHTGSRRYLYGDVQVQACQNKPEPGQAGLKSLCLSLLAQISSHLNPLNQFTAAW